MTFVPIIKKIANILGCWFLAIVMSFFMSTHDLNAKSKKSKRTTSKAYKKATRGTDEVVKKKLFPKKLKVEVSVPDVGVILNQSYIDTFVFHGNFTYYTSEKWGFGFEGLFAVNSDKVERYCIENFYNDPKNEVSDACPLPGNDPQAPLETSGGGFAARANFGPAYVPVREINSIFAGCISST